MANKQKGLIFISNVQKALEHEWFCDYVNKEVFDLEFVLFNSQNSDLHNFIINRDFKCNNYSLRNKFYIPFYIFFFYFKMLFTKYNFVHCHLFEASLIGIIAAKFSGIKKRIYTRHHSDFHHVYFPGAVKYDLLINKYSTHIIAVSEVVKDVLVIQESVADDKVTVIEHAIDLSLFDKNKIDINRVFHVKEKYRIPPDAYVVGVISRFTVWKGVQFIIPAFKKYLELHPNSILVLANANGECKENLLQLLNELPNNSYRLIDFEADSAALFQTFDVFVHAPISPVVEAFGQVYIEALASSIPCIFTKSGIGSKILIDKVNSLVVEYSNPESIFGALKNIRADEKLKSKLIENGINTVRTNFSIDKKNQSILWLYEK